MRLEIPLTRGLAILPVQDAVRGERETNRAAAFSFCCFHRIYAKGGSLGVYVSFPVLGGWPMFYQYGSGRCTSSCPDSECLP